MPARSPESSPQVVSVGTMARLCQLSRSRFYELIADGVMPAPVYDIRTRRPMFTPELQAECLRVRSTNVGVNGDFILFYAARSSTTATMTTATRPRSTVRATAAASTEPIGELMDALCSLGLTDVREPEVRAAVGQCFPSGTIGTAEGDVIRTVFRHLRRTDRGGITSA